MIKVNLIPLERRRPEKTPVPRFLVIIIGCAISTALGFLCLYTWKETIGEAEATISEKSSTYQQLLASNKDYEKKKAERDIVQQYEISLNTLQNSRKVLWYHKLDLLCSLLDKENYAWVDDVKCEVVDTASGGGTGKAKKANEPVLEYSLSFSAYTMGEQLSNEHRFKQAIIDSFLRKDEFNSWNGDALPSVLQEFSDYNEKAARFLPLKLEFYSMPVEKKKAGGR